MINAEHEEQFAPRQIAVYNYDNFLDASACRQCRLLYKKLTVLLTAMRMCL